MNQTLDFIPQFDLKASCNEMAYLCLQIQVYISQQFLHLCSSQVRTPEYSKVVDGNRVFTVAALSSLDG